MRNRRQLIDDLIKLDMAMFLGGRSFVDFLNYLTTEDLIICDDQGVFYGY